MAHPNFAIAMGALLFLAPLRARQGAQAPAGPRRQSPARRLALIAAAVQLFGLLLVLRIPGRRA